METVSMVISPIPMMTLTVMSHWKSWHRVALTFPKVKELRSSHKEMSREVMV